MGTFLSKFITISLTSLTWSVLACLIRAFLAFLLAAEVMAFKNIFCLWILSISIFFAYSTRGSIPCGCITVFLYVLVFRDSFWSSPSPPPPPPPLPPATRRPPPATRHPSASRRWSYDWGYYSFFSQSVLFWYTVVYPSLLNRWIMVNSPTVQLTDANLPTYKIK